MLCLRERKIGINIVQRSYHLRKRRQESGWDKTSVCENLQQGDDREQR